MSAQWYCVIANPNCQAMAERILAELGHRAFAPRLRKWISHARVKKVVERPILGRYLFVEVDYPRQSFAHLKCARGVSSILAVAGVPVVMPRHEVEDLLRRYLEGEFDQIANAAIPIGARVAIVEGQFADWLATVTGVGKGGRMTLKLLGSNQHLNKVSISSIRPAEGFDLRRSKAKGGVDEPKA